MLLILLLCLLTGSVAGAGRNVTLANQCSCGFEDPKTKTLYTESIIMYFNESGVDRNVFRVRDYQKKTEKGWNTIFKQGASPLNVLIGSNNSLQWQDYVDGTSPSLQMHLDPFHFDHNSVGAELRSQRRDIIFGHFRASMRSAPPWVGGSAMSMYLEYNDTQNINLDLLNMNAADQARVMQIIDGEWPSYALATNYSVIEKGDPPKIPPGHPWDFMDVGFDWSRDKIDFFVGKNRTRRVTKAEKDLTSTPETLYLSHWSTGDTHYMQGPPMNGSMANVRWIRAFFNSSLMTSTDHKRYNRMCNMTRPCSIDDMTLRGSTEYSPAATAPWKPPVMHQHIRVIAGYIAAGFSFFGIFVIMNALIRRGPWYKIKRMEFPGSKRASTQALRRSLRASIGADLALNYPGPPSDPPYAGVFPAAGFETPAPGYTSRPDTQNGGTNCASGAHTPLPPYRSRIPSPGQSVHSLISPKRSVRSINGRPSHSRNRSTDQVNRLREMHSGQAEGLTPPVEDVPSFVVTSPLAEEEEDDYVINAARARAYLDLSASEEDHNTTTPSDSGSRTPSPGSAEKSRLSSEKRQARLLDEKAHISFMDLDDSRDEKRRTIKLPPAPQDKSVATDIKSDSNVPDGMTGGATAVPSKEQKPVAPNQPQQRIDYLAGLVAVCCIMVTLRHFSLTFWPYVTTSQGNVMHFHADKVFSYILGPYLLTPLWIGPFFVTSCRFLAQRYLKTGSLKDIANKMLLRAPRMLIPVFVFMTLEYFLISLGLTGYLEWLPSVSYSVWPYVIPQPNFAVFVNEMVEISYLTLNAAPEVINHYCVGVLWTIPVQLQFSFVVLLATVLIKDVKKPWKRMLFYFVSIVAGWYGSSWSACHWLGLLLADADITYNWVKWTQARWWAHYPILTIAFLVTMATPLVLLFNSAFFSFSFMAWENAIHPDPTTGLPIYKTIPSIWWAYPQYYAPNFAILTFSAGLQIIVELSTWAQKALSIKLITFFHPHIMTIYRTSAPRDREYHAKLTSMQSYTASYSGA